MAAGLIDRDGIQRTLNLHAPQHSRAKTSGYAIGCYPRTKEGTHWVPSSWLQLTVVLLTARVACEGKQTQGQHAEDHHPARTLSHAGNGVGHDDRRATRAFQREIEGLGSRGAHHAAGDGARGCWAESYARGV